MAGRAIGVTWRGRLDGVVDILDQRRLPDHRRSSVTGLAGLADLVAAGACRGGSTIGVASAYTLVAELHRHCQDRPPGTRADVLAPLLRACRAELAPLAARSGLAEHVGRRFQDCLDRHELLLTLREMLARLWQEARRIESDDRHRLHALSHIGLQHLDACDRVWTADYTGSATGGEWGTVIGCLRQAALAERRVSVVLISDAPDAPPIKQAVAELEMLQLAVEIRSSDSLADATLDPARERVLLAADRLDRRGLLLTEAPEARRLAAWAAPHEALDVVIATHAWLLHSPINGLADDRLTVEQVTWLLTDQRRLRRPSMELLAEFSGEWHCPPAN